MNPVALPSCLHTRSIRGSHQSSITENANLWAYRKIHMYNGMPSIVVVELRTLRNLEGLVDEEPSPLPLSLPFFGVVLEERAESRDSLSRCSARSFVEVITHRNMLSSVDLPHRRGRRTRCKGRAQFMNCWMAPVLSTKVDSSTRLAKSESATGSGLS